VSAEEGDQLVQLLLVLSPLATSQRPRASAQLTFLCSCRVPVTTTVVANSGPPVAP